MRKLKVILIVWTVIPTVIYGQVNLKIDSFENPYDQINGENIFIHQNASVLIAGEQLYYKIYCIDPEMTKLSHLSKVAYVELVGDNNYQVFKHKIKLTSGLGQGDFIVPTSVPSGNYKILGYTEWMKNFGKKNFFQSDLSIINPYQNNEKLVLQKSDTTRIDFPKNNSESTIQIGSLRQGNTSENLKLNLNKKVYDTRSKVSIRIQGILEPGNYSITVRKNDLISKFLIPTSKTYRSLFKNNSKPLNEKIYVPDIRGELIYGSLVSFDTNLPVSSKKVALSIPGKEHVFLISTTNKDGVFYFNLDNRYANTNASIQVLGENREVYQILMNRQSSIDLNVLVFEELKINQQTIDLIVQRSIHNQVEHAYLKVKQDSIKPNTFTKPFYENQALTYNLDDYTRFSTIEETIFEIINEVWIKKNEDEYTFHVREKDHTSILLLPLVLLDGKPIHDHKELTNISATKIEKISVFKEIFSIGTQIYQGCISFETFDGYTQNNTKEEYVVYLDLLKPQPKKIYFNQRYDTNMKSSMSHIPDYRYQLLWVPNFDLNSNETKLIAEFFTSDITGEFEISLEGFTNDGLPVSLKESFTVK